MSNKILPEIAAALQGVKTPAGDDIVASGLIINSQRQDDVAQVILEIPGGNKKSIDAYQDLKKSIEQKLQKIPGVKKAMVIMTMTRAATTDNAKAAPTSATTPNPFAEQKPIPAVKKIIAVASGKGGVGKSTAAFNLALALQYLGQKVALLDADIYGPSVPTLSGLAHKKPDGDKDGNMIPLTAFNMEINSIGFLLEDNQPTIWRGPMVMSALTQLLFKTAWGAVLGPRDIMVVDLPPGTGDAQLTLIQRVPLAGAVIVSTPQDLALLDAGKAVAMFQKLNIPILGLIENMSYFVCDQCGKEHDIFSRGGAQVAAKDYGVDFLGAVPLTKDLRSASDSGTPLVHKKNDNDISTIFSAIGKKIITALK
ncbi:MAG: Mrp/NBP35 family ATP-binding protein [Hydrotalea sp.]|nr:Mrp/NBP35 family ATP-binding protein [Hydrotalea sp.]